MNMQLRNALMQRVAVVILTYNRAAELQRTLTRMLALPTVPVMVVVDNGSVDGTACMMQQCFPQVRLIALPKNMGAAARNIGVRAVDTPYVAFCDDDTWWAGGSLEAAVALLDTYLHVALLCARVLVGKEETEDPTCALMAASPLPRDGLPGPALLGFLAGASMIRRSAFIEAGGYETKLFIGGEEDLLALDLVSHGWRLAYVPELVVHHHPSSQRDSNARKKCLVRNALWICWMRFPWLMAARKTSRILRKASCDGVLLPALLDALRATRWVLQRRKVISPEVVRLHRLLHD
jgi:GT2 family glycosyltransferase